jgi:hypothetical protein
VPVLCHSSNMMPVLKCAKCISGFGLVFYFCHYRGRTWRKCAQ